MRCGSSCAADEDVQGLQLDALADPIALLHGALSI
jgi:hypothetical protein